MTFEELQKANETIRTTNIKGKEYAEVNQRIRVFRMLHPDGQIHTSIESLENHVCVMKATICDANGIVLATGHAYENEDSSFINKTSYIENCETSAVGRALGMLGIGIDTSVASSEEVQNAMLQQEEKKVVSGTKVKALISRCESEGVDVGKILTLYKVAKLEDLNEKQYANINQFWEKIKEQE